MTQARSPILFAMLAAVSAVGPLANHIFLPSLPAIQNEFMVSSSVVQMVLSLSIVAMAVANLIYGPLSDRHGRKPVLFVGMIVFVIGSVVCMMAPSISILILGRIIQAAGGAAGLVVARAVVTDLYPAERVAAVIGHLTIAMVMGTMVSPAIGGFLNDLYSWRAPFVLLTVVGAVIAFMVLARLPESNQTRAKAMNIGHMILVFGRLLRTRRFNLYSFHGAFAMSIFFAFIAGAPYVMVNVMGRPAAEYGLYFMLISTGFVIGNFLTTRVSGRWGADRMILMGSVLALASTLTIGAFLVAGYWIPLALFGPGMVAGFANGLTLPNSQSGALRIDPSAAGTASGLTGFLQLMLIAAVSQAVGMLQNDTPYPMVGLMIGCSIIALWLALMLREKTPTA